MTTAPRLVGFALAGAALIGVGVFLARATSDSASPAAEPAAAPVATTAPEARPAPSAARPVKPPALPTAEESTGTAKGQLAGLDRDLHAPDPKIRRAALREAVTAEPPNLRVLREAVRDADLEVSFLATDTLGRLHAQGKVTAAELAAIALDPARDERVRIMALSGLGQVASTEAADTLVGVMRSPDVTARRNAAILLANQDLAVAIPVLIDALGDADDIVRANALASLRARARGRDYGTDASAWRAWWQSQPAP